MTSAEVEKPESRWGIGALVAFSFVLMVLLLSTPILFRAFLFQPFNTPSNSMAPTLLVGDYFFVAKYAYGRGAEPTRGDVVGFLSTKDHSTVFVKRVVGLPGERIQMKDGLLHINGVPVARERLATRWRHVRVGEAFPGTVWSAQTARSSSAMRLLKSSVYA